MFQYYIMEIQKYADGSYGHIVHVAYDEDATLARNKAESKYHEVLAAAAVSQLPSHSATILSTDGRQVANQCYYHAIPAPEPEPEPEPEPTPEPEGE